MVGRASYENIWMLGDIDRRVYGKPNLSKNRREILEIYGEYGQLQIEENRESGNKERVGIGLLNKPIINLFDGERHSNKYSQYLSVA